MFFLCFNETWTNNISINSYQVDGYNLANSYSRVNRIRGGVAIYVRSDISYKPIDLNKFCLELDIEVCAISCHIYNKKTILLNCYRSPDGNIGVFLGKIEEVIDSIFDPHCDMIICGDFNFNYFNKKCTNFFKLSNIFSSYGLSHRGGWPTRVTDSSLSCIDHIFTNNNQYVSCVYDNTFSDHRTTLMEFNVSPKKLSKVYVWKRNYGEEEILKFKHSLQTETWQSVYGNSTLSESFESFFNILQYYFNIHFPLHKSCKEISSKGWVSQCVKNSSNNLRDLYCFSQKHPELKPFYLEAKKEHIKLVRDTKRSFYQNRILSSTNTTKACWQVVNQLTNKKSQHKNIVLCDQENKPVREPLAVANTFNSFFKNAPIETLQKINSSDVLPDLSTSIENNFKLCPYTEQELCDLLSEKLKNSKSSGFDELPNFLIKQVVFYFIKPLTYLVNLSFCYGEFPNKIKIGKVIPIFKKENERKVENYRPISVPSVISKIFEYAFLDRLLKHLKNNKILSENQHGFINGKSTMSAVHFFYEKLVELVDAGECPVGIFCDLSRAFDCVDHNKFLALVERYGFIGGSFDWTKSFLTGRQQYVSLQNIDFGNNIRTFTSSMLNISTGVPQGSILGPIFFILFINQFDTIDPEALFAAFADDVSSLISDHSDTALEYKCSNLIKKIDTWFSDYSLYLNPSKTTLMRFHHAQKRVNELEIRLDDKELSFSDSTKFLGLYIDKNLNWKTHCEYLIPRVNSQSYVLRQLKSVLTIEQLIQVYFANVDARLRYGVCFWGWSTLSEDVFVAQKRCIRSLAGIPKSHSCREYFKKFNILTVPSLFLYEICLFVFNCDKFKKNCDIHNLNTRNSSNLHTNICKSKLAFRSPQNIGPLVFNKLPNNIKNCKSLKQFKHMLKTFLIERTFYRVEEYLPIII